MATAIIAPQAEAQYLAIDEWWQRNRPAAPDLFDSEFRAAVAQLEILPNIGRRFPHPVCPDCAGTCCARAAITSTTCPIAMSLSFWQFGAQFAVQDQIWGASALEPNDVAPAQQGHCSSCSAVELSG
jgi:hypothetical protein